MHNIHGSIKHTFEYEIVLEAAEYQNKAAIHTDPGKGKKKKDVMIILYSKHTINTIYMKPGLSLFLEI